MSTRGAYGFKKGKTIKATYNHSDSYPTGLGLTMVHFIQQHSDEELLELYNKIVLVTDATPLPVDINERDWDEFLRPVEGEPEALFDYEKTRHAMIDSKEFLKDSLFCEYYYLIEPIKKVLIFNDGKKNKEYSFELLRALRGEDKINWLKKLEAREV